jgi:Holliday junction resolvase RusA-like endonuclease
VNPAQFKALAVSFDIPGNPLGWARAGRHGKFSFTPKPQAEYMALVRQIAALAMKGQPPIKLPVRISLSFGFARPKSHYRTGRYSNELKPGADQFKHTSRPDLSNLIKLIEDACNGVVFVDDSQVCVISASKVYVDKPGCRVSIWVDDETIS